MLFSSIILDRMETYNLEESERGWLSKANMVATEVREGNYLVDSSNNTLFRKLINDKSTENSARILVVDASGFVVMDSSGADMYNTLMNSTVLSALKNQEKADKATDYPIMTTAVPVLDKDKTDVLGAVVLVASIDSVFLPIEEMKNQIYLLSLVIALIAGLLSFATSSFITKPLKTLMKFEIGRAHV